jgi:dTDP-4-dehydrorhamnose 3,5-epimerase-like enzyme
MKIESLTLIDYPKFPEENGQLSVFQAGNGIPYDIKRVFTVLANSGDIRGDHAHITCSQSLICLAGEVKLTCDDGKGNKQTFVLNRQSKGVLIPPKIWAIQEYLADQSVLMVICDQVYDPADYIRDYEIFIKFIKAES